MNVEARLAAAIDAHAAGDLDGAETGLRLVLEAAPDHARARATLARVLVASGRRREAVRVAKRAVALSSDDLYAHTILVEVLVAAERHEEALEAARVFARQPCADEAALAARLRAAIASARLASSGGAGAVHDARAATELDADSADAQLVLARALARAFRLADAARAAARAEELAPDAEPIVETVAAIAAAISAAEASLESAEAAPCSIEDWLTVATLRLSLGHRESALDALDRAVALAPSDPEVWTARDDLLRRMGLPG